MQELADLRKFLSHKPNDENSDFAWWLWTAAGGQGKTRLASQICLEAQRDKWKCGFLSTATKFDAWDRWVVDQATLIVVDHVAHRATDLQSVICTLARNPTNIRKPLRFLLLERPFQDYDGWVRDFVPPAGSEDYADFFDHAYVGIAGAFADDLQDVTYALESPDEHEQWEIFTSVLRAKGAPVPDPLQAKRLLQKADPLGRPLYTILAAEAVAEHGLDKLRQWRRQDLVRNVLRREFDLWDRSLGVSRSPPGSEYRVFFEEHIALIVLATIIDRFDVQFITRDQELKSLIPKRILPDWMRIITGDKENKGQEVQPIKPDTVGELFLLERLSGNLGSDANSDIPKSQTRRLLDLGFAHRPTGTIDCVRRCVEDFPDHPALRELMAFRVPEIESDYALCMEYMHHASNLGGILMDGDHPVDGDRPDLALILYHCVIDECKRFEKSASEYGLYSGFLERLVTIQYNCAVANLRLDKAIEAEQNLNYAIAQFDRPDLLNDANSKTHRMKILLSALGLRANLLLERDCLDDALNDADRILVFCAGSPSAAAEAHLVRGQIFGKRGDDDGSLSEYKRLLALKGEISTEIRKYAIGEAYEVLWQRAHIAQRDGDAELAVKYYTEIIDMTRERPDLFASALVNRSVVYLSLKDLPLCIRDCSEVLLNAAAPSSQKAKALINRSQAHVLLDDIGQAQSDAEAAVSLLNPPEPDWGIGMFVLAQIHRVQGNRSTAFAVASRVLEASNVDLGIRDAVQRWLVSSDLRRPRGGA